MDKAREHMKRYESTEGRVEHEDMHRRALSSVATQDLVRDPYTRPRRAPQGQHR